MDLNQGLILIHPSSIFRDRSKMTCRYFYGVHPFMKIAPVKEEEVFLEPRLVLYHDVITDNELDVVKKLATPRVRL